MKKKYIARNLKETQKIAQNLAKEILKNKTGIVIGLEGELGSGKTAFLQGFAKGLAVKEKILSPTFVIYKKFKIQNPKIQNFYHFDCYRIQKPEEIFDLGFKEIISNPQNIVAIEWAVRIKKIMPKTAIWIKFKLLGETSRRIDIIGRL